MSKNKYIQGTVPIPGFAPIVEAIAEAVGVYQLRTLDNFSDMGFYDDPENSGRIPGWMAKSLAIMIWVAAIGWLIKWLWKNVLN